MTSIQEKGFIDEIGQFGVRQDSLSQIIGIKQKEIESLKLRCNKLEEEKGNSILELKQTQVMSSEQLEKLSNLETKQDLLEIENTETMNRLIESENKNSDLDKQCKMLQEETVVLQSKALNLSNELKEVEHKSKTEENGEISRLIDSTKDYEYKLGLIEEENTKLKLKILALQSNQNDSYNQQNQKHREHSFELQSMKNEHEKMQRFKLEQIRMLEKQVKKTNVV